MKKIIFLSTISALFFCFTGFSLAKKAEPTTGLETPSPLPTETPTPPPKWIPAPIPKDDARNLSFDIYSTYQDDVSGSRLFSIGDLYARRKLDEYSVTTDFQIRFEKGLSTTDTAQSIDLRMAKITYIEPWMQFSVGRFDIYSVLTPMSFFGAYPDMGIHRVDGAMIVLPLFFNIGIENFKSAQAPPLALTMFYTPSLLEAGDVVLDTEQALLISQIRARFKLMNVQTTWRATFAWSGSDYFSYSTLNGNMAGSIAADAALDTDVSIYGEAAVQNFNYFSNTDVAALGVQIHGIGTWGPFSLDEITAEGQLPMENDPANIFSGGNVFNPTLVQPSTLSWFGSLKARVKAVSITFAITNNLDDFTFNRVTPQNSAFPLNGPVGPGRELEKSQIPLVAVSNTQPGFLISLSTDF